MNNGLTVLLRFRLPSRLSLASSPLPMLSLLWPFVVPTSSIAWMALVSK